MSRWVDAVGYGKTLINEHVEIIENCYRYHGRREGHPAAVETS